ncbi:hypothetical protein L484_000433 [Morus notabilis]|uniref:Hyccin n=1 Tax=Morus notabilis TaxID=981085 RepID=W9SE80_9ROSA|nr:uncharacterized protein LOC21384069 [Morus notabilis]EXC45156.1 hypothetical protein L484_000433 [Morus notabilis]
MSNNTATFEITVAAGESAPPSNSFSKTDEAIRYLSTILPSIPSSLSSSSNPSLSLLHDPEISTHISALLRRPSAGTGDDNLCRWLYDAFQSGDPGLHLVVLRYIPLLAGAYLSLATLWRPLAGFEAILLALYSHETTSRAGQPVTVNVPDMSHPSLYHESTSPAKNNSTALNLSIVSPTLEPHGAVRSTRRARIVGVALELYFGKIHEMPKSSKIDFCEFCRVWAGDRDDDRNKQSDPSRVGEVNDSEDGVAGRRIPLPWELLQPILRILGHCVMARWANDKEVFDAAKDACRSLHVRAVHDTNAKAILAAESLLRLGNMASLELTNEDEAADPTEIPTTNILTLN